MELNRKQELAMWLFVIGICTAMWVTKVDEPKEKPTQQLSLEEIKLKKI